MDEHARPDGEGPLIWKHFGNLSLMEMQSPFGRGPTHLLTFSLKNLPQFIKFLKIVLFCLLLKKSLPNPRSLRFSPMLTYKNFTVLVLSFRSMIHFEFLFLSSEKIFG